MKNFNVENIGKIIKKRRNELGLTQEMLSEKVGICAVYMSFIETGKRTPSMKTFANICRELSIEFEKND